ncbi:MAG: DMT family transporter, partial [Acidobacteriota bacterium]
IASLSWASYALAQKQLLRRLSSQQILWMIYIGATVLLAPTAHLGELSRLDATTGWLLVFCCANTVIGYGAFAEALEHWEVSRVSAVIATAPLFTLLGMWLVAKVAPGVIEPETLTGLSVAGALLVVAGSALSAFGQRAKAG